MVDSKKFTFESEGLGDIRKEVDATNRALQRLEHLYDEVTKRGGKAAQNARNLINQQRLEIKQRGLSLVDIKERIDVTETGPESGRPRSRPSSRIPPPRPRRDRARREGRGDRVAHQYLEGADPHHWRQGRLQVHRDPGLRTAGHRTRPRDGRPCRRRGAEARGQEQEDPPGLCGPG